MQKEPEKSGNSPSLGNFWYFLLLLRPQATNAAKTFFLSFICSAHLLLARAQVSRFGGGQVANRGGRVHGTIVRLSWLHQMRMRLPCAWAHGATQLSGRRAETRLFLPGKPTPFSDA